MSETFEYQGHKFTMRLERDDTMGAPWEEHDGHGPVSEWTRRGKYPGERVLCEDNGSYRYYDFTEAVKIAKRDGWDAEPYKTGTRGQQAVRAVEADFKNLKGWADDDWCWVGVVVSRCCECCGAETKDNTASLWGIESYSPDYHREVAEELAAEILAR